MYLHIRNECCERAVNFKREEELKAFLSRLGRRVEALISWSERDDRIQKWSTPFSLNN